MEFFDLFAAPKPAPAVIIRNIPGEQIELVNTRDLAGQTSEVETGATLNFLVSHSQEPTVKELC